MDDKEKYLSSNRAKIKSDNSLPGNRLNLNTLLDRLKAQQNNEKKIKIVGYFLMLIVLAFIIILYTKV